MKAFLSLVLMTLPGLLFFLPLMMPRGKWLTGYAWVSTLAILGVWIQHFLVTNAASGHHNPGEALGFGIATFLTLLHLLGMLIRGVVIALRTPAEYE